MAFRHKTLSLALMLTPRMSVAVMPQISDDVAKAAATIHADPVMQKMLTEVTSPAAQEWRFVNQMEITRIASPSRSEMRRLRHCRVVRKPQQIHDRQIKPKGLCCR